MSAFDKLKKKASPKKKKSEHVREVQDDTLNDTCERVVRASKALKNAEATYDKEQAVLVDYARKLHGESFDNEGPAKSYKINEQVMCTFTDKFSALDEHDIEEATSILAKKKVDFDRLFKQKATIKVRSDIAENEAKLQKLVELLGDKINEYFDVKVETVLVNDFDQIVAREGVYAEISEIVERHRAKPSIKVIA